MTRPSLIAPMRMNFSSHANIAVAVQITWTLCPCVLMSRSNKCHKEQKTLAGNKGSKPQGSPIILSASFRY